MSFKSYLNKKEMPAPGGGSLIKENDPNGYFTKAELVDYCDKLSSDPKLRHLIGNINVLFLAMKQNIELPKDPNHIVEDGQGYTWVRLKIGRVSKNVKIIHFGDMKRLIQDYAEKSIKIDQTLEELYDEASS